MYTITVWNRNSTNFGANLFVDQNGTDVIEVDSMSQAMRKMDELTNNAAIDEAILECPGGVLSWKQNEPCSSQEAGDGWCDCDQCSGDCPCNDDDDDFDLNDPRM